MNETGCTKDTKLNELIAKIQDIIGIISNSNQDVESICDKLEGEKPGVPPDQDKENCRSGVLGRIEDAVDRLNIQANDIRQSINRLRDINMV